MRKHRRRYLAIRKPDVKGFMMRWIWLAVVTAGAGVMIAAGVSAIMEGYASDAEMRGGNIVPALIMGLLGVVLVLVGLCGQAQRLRAARK